MNRFFLFIMSVLITFTECYSQANGYISYQAIARNSSGELIANAHVVVRISVRDSVSSGEILFREIHNVTTSSYGVFSVNIGAGITDSGSFVGIDWGKKNKILQVEMSDSTGDLYHEVSVQQFMSVPYANYAKKAKTLGYNGFRHYVGEVWGGGVVFHVFKGSDGTEHGLIVSPNEVVPTEFWGGGSSWTDVCCDSAVGISAQSSWNGLANSIAIVSQVGHTGSAAKLCLDLVSGGYDDWYLPAIDELKLIWNSAFQVNNGLASISGGDILNINQWFHPEYWSSTELTGDWAFWGAWSIDFYNGITNNNLGLSKSYGRSVRAVRSF